jgi:hypothetical protein
MLRIGPRSTSPAVGWQDEKLESMTRLSVLAMLTLAVGGCESSGPPLSSCTFFKERACWQCGECSKLQKVSVGCRGRHDCLLFCGNCFAEGYPQCKMYNPAEPNCKDWVFPKGTIEGCDALGTYSGFPEYDCDFCPWPKLLFGEYARGSDGVCVFFLSGVCRPDDYVEDRTCKNDSGMKAHDGGVE